MRKLNWSWMNLTKASLFLILPVLFLIIGLMVTSEMGYYYLYSSDPEYAFLLNGLNFLNFHFPYVVMGPATPLHAYCAAVTGIVYLFRGGDSLNVDVLQNQDLYLHYINLSLIVVTSITLFLLGYMVYKSQNKDIFSGLFVQLTVFSSWLIYDLMRRIMVENLEIIGMLFLIILIFKYLKYPPEKYKLFDKYVIGFSVVVGFIAATKLMYLSVAIIPFILIEGYKRKASYVVLTIIFFFIFGIAVFSRWDAFFNWYWDNFMHSGQYGEGAKTIIDTTVYKNNFVYIFFTDSVFFKLFVLNTIALVIYHLPFLKVKQKNDKHYKAMLGMYIAVAVMILLVAKQFKYYYMVTAILLQIPALLLAIQVFSRNLSKKWKYIVFTPIVSFILIFIYIESSKSFNEHEWFVKRKNNYLESVNFVEKNLTNKPVLILPDYYGAPFKEFGPYFGLGWLGSNTANIYAEILKEIYPQTYFYHDWNKNFYHWGDIYSYTDLLKKYKTLYLFSNDKNLENKLFDKLHGINRQLDTKYTLLKVKDDPYEVYFKVEYDSSKKMQGAPIYFDFEEIDTVQGNFINRDGLSIKDAVTRSQDFAFSGKWSAKTFGEFEYALTFALSEIKAGEHYKISIWRYNNPDAGLVIEGPQDKYYQYYGNVSEKANGWEKIDLDFIVPDNLEGESVKIYCWNKNKDVPAYFDDLSIQKVE